MEREFRVNMQPASLVVNCDSGTNLNAYVNGSLDNTVFNNSLLINTRLLIEGLALFIRRRAGGTAIPRELTAVYAAVLRAVGFAVSLVFAALGLALPLVRPRSSVPIAVGFPVVIGLALVGGMIWAARETRRLRASGMALPEGYHGVFYSNARDTRLWVPRVSGIGWTINFAHRLAWPVLIALLGVPLAVALLIAFAGR